MRDQPWPGAAALDGQVRRRGLEHALAHAAGVAGPDVADHLEPGRHLLQHLGHVLAEAGELVPAAAAAHHLRLVRDGLARQVVRQRPAHGYLAWPGRSRGRCWIRDGGLALGLVLLQVLQPQLKLRDVGVPALGRLAVVLAAQHRQLCPQVFDLGHRRAKPRPHRGQLVPECGDLFLGCAMCQVHSRNPSR